MTIRFRVLGAVVAPLLLAGCGMPIGVQVASLLADGVSLFTTDKTLTDHGLSAATGEDCAMWRGLKGDEICRDDPNAETELASNEVTVSDAGPLMGDADLADYAGPVVAPAPTATAEAAPEPWHEPVDPKVVAAAGPEWAPTPLVPSAEPAPTGEPAKPGEMKSGQTKVIPAPVVEARLEPLAPIGTGAAPALPSAEHAPTAEPAKAGEIKAGHTGATGAAPALPGPIPTAAPVKAEAKTAPTVTRVPAEAAPRGGVFYVIGSYRRLEYAERFAGRQKGLDMLILSGALKGKPIYRVAVGPVPDAGRAQVRAGLARAGHRDAWALTLKAPRVAAELAELHQ